MGNASTSAKGALAVASAKNQLSKTFSGESDGKDHHKENPETRREMNKRHREREMEFKRRKQERERKTASMTQKWSENRASMQQR